MEVHKVSTFQRYGGGPVKAKVHSNSVCHFWLAGKCNRNPCTFQHRELTTPSKRECELLAKTTSLAKKRSATDMDSLISSCTHMVRIKTGTQISLVSPKKNSGAISPPAIINGPNSTKKTKTVTSLDKQPSSPNNMSAAVEIDTKPTNSGAATNPPAIIIEPPPFTKKPCLLWMYNDCAKGDGCPFLHSWSTGETFSILARLDRTTSIKGICGIALPSGSDKLYSSNNAGLVSVWDCHTGKLTETTNLAQTTTCLTGEGVWVFVGLRNSIKAINSWTKEAYTLGAEKPAAPFGFVYAIVTSGDVLFAGTQMGSILAWKGSHDKVEPFKLFAELKGHAKTVLCLAVRMKRLYSGSSDRTIRVWDVDTFECLQVMKEHDDAVRSVICWDNYLISGSHDKKIKVWATTQEGTIEVVYTHDVKSGVVSLCAIQEAKNPVLLCSCIDWCVRLYDLPSFKERGRIYGKDEVTRMVKAPGGLFFSGDFLGTVSVWKFSESLPIGQQPSAL